MGIDLQCSRIAFLAAVNVFDVLILSDALFHTLAASHVNLFFAFVVLCIKIGKINQVKLLKFIT
jgi:hypothetical protein